MKNKFIILFSIAMIFSLPSCLEDCMFITGNGISVTETNRTAGFNKIENSTSIDINNLRFRQNNQLLTVIIS